MYEYIWLVYESYWGNELSMHKCLADEYGRVLGVKESHGLHQAIGSKFIENRWSKNDFILLIDTTFNSGHAYDTKKLCNNQR